LLICLAGPTRLELATSGVTGRRSNQLNYDPAKGLTLKLSIVDCRLIQSAIRNQQFFRPTRAMCHPRGGLAKLAEGERRLLGGTGLEPVAAGV
jgi:hypothetical protein